MKHIVRKAYCDYEKEEKWLNEMSAMGLALTDYSWCRYVFEETPNNKYIYRIELLKNLPTHPESMAYIKFLEESGVECVATYMCWLYLRKKSSEGAFDIYSDMESKLKHLKRINAYWSTLMWAELLTGISNIVIGVENMVSDSRAGIFPINFYLGGLLLLVTILCFKLGSPVRKKINKLQQELIIRE